MKVTYEEAGALMMGQDPWKKEPDKNKIIQISVMLGLIASLFTLSLSNKSDLPLSLLIATIAGLLVFAFVYSSIGDSK